MMYTQFCESSLVDQEVEVPVKAGSWIAEAALWAEWTHVGKLTARYACQVISVDASGLQETLNAHEQISDFTRKYAKDFCLRLRAASPPFTSYPSDLHVPGADPDILFSEQAYQGLLTSEWEAGKLKCSEENYLELLDEVTREKSAVVSTGHGLQRVVFVCALQLKKGDEILVKVGKWTEKNGLEPAGAVLPGVKRKRSELPHEVLQRLVNDRLHGIEDIRMSYAIEEAEYKESSKFGMMTKYLRTVNFADIREDASAPPMAVVDFVDGAPPDHLPEYCASEVYVIHCAMDKADLYAWLSEPCVDALRGDEEDVLTSWMASLDPAGCKPFTSELFEEDDKHSV